MRVDEEDPEAADILSTDVPFANGGGVKTIDVLSQVCEEVIEHSLQAIQQAASQAEPSTRKEYRIKLCAIEAFRKSYALASSTT